MESAELIALAERCEAATGPDRELDAAIAPDQGFRVVNEGHPFGRCCYDIHGISVALPRYTASLDAALTLVPAGYAWDVDATVPEMGIDWTIHEPIPDGDTWKGTSGLPALALCAAALRARAQAAQPSGGEE